MTTRNDIREWLEQGIEQDATHVVVMCDMFSNDNYPVFISVYQNVRDEVTQRNGKNMQRVIEVYNLSMDIEEQLQEIAACNY